MVETVTLNAAAITSLNAATAAWTVGAAVTTGSGGSSAAGTFQRVLRASGATAVTPATELVLQVCGGGSNPPPTPTPVKAAFLDTGYFLRAVDNTGAAVQSLRFESPAGEHQGYLTGNQAIGTAPAITNIERRSYFAFDLAARTAPATAAKLRLWVSKPGPANGNTGCYTSADAMETFALQSVDMFTLAQIQAVKANDTANHAVNVPVWTDLGDGDELGTAVFTAACETTDLVVSPNGTNPSVDCSTAAAPCGKWQEITLNAAALAKINATTGQWVFGGRISTIGSPTTGERHEWLFGGALVDMKSTSTVFPDFDTPAPELELTL
jgi:hypothetical protein